MNSETLILGGGVIGLSLAWELAGRGQSVTVLERHQPGREASWAGAGILPPGRLDGAREPFDRLRAYSAPLWDDWSQQLFDETGVDTGYRHCGALEVDFDPTAVASELAFWNGEGVTTQPLDSAGLREFEPELSPEIPAGFRLPELSQVRNPRQLAALVAGCQRRNVRILSGRQVIRIGKSENRVTEVATLEETFPVQQLCVCAGAWSGALLQDLGFDPQIAPVRGQIVLLNPGRPLLSHVIEVGKRYLVPRPDGRVLVGATEEQAGFDKRTTAAAVAGLIAFATRLVPALGEAEVERTWAGLRPFPARGVPFLGRLPEWDNAYIAAGHFRAGLQTSPGTALLMAQLLTGQTPDIDLAAFAP